MSTVPLAGLIIWTLGGAGFTLLGVYGLRHPDRMAEFFRSRGTDVVGKKTADRIYTQRNQRWALVFFLILGPLLVVIGVVGIVSKIVA